MAKKDESDLSCERRLGAKVRFLLPNSPRNETWQHDSTGTEIIGGKLSATASDGEQDFGCTDVGESDFVSPVDSGFGDPEVEDEMSMEIDSLCEDVERMDISHQRVRANSACATPQMAGEDDYKEEIFSYLWETERKYMLPPNYLSGQPELSPHTRAVVIDWLVQVHEYYGYSPDVLYLAVSLTDRYLAREEEHVSLDNLQLVGVVCFQLSCKYEDRFVLDLDELSQLVEGGFSPVQIRQMEVKVCFTLEFNLNNPLSIHFLRAIARETNCDVKVYVLAKYFLELSLLEPSLSGRLPSLTAYSSVSLAQAVVSNSPSMPWVQQASYNWTEIRKCAQALSRLILRSSKSQWQYPAIREKYSREVEFAEIPHLLASSPVVRRFASGVDESSACPSNK